MVQEVQPEEYSKPKVDVWDYVLCKGYTQSKVEVSSYALLQKCIT